ncbi:MAG: pyruvate, phosphate dikinase [Planctomycetes bacterium B3_Pla]|nr:MAG: pyruvate, phosphate dikinase [Planctomycetes bacterium B3_Pla]
MAQKRVYFFGGGKAEGNAKMKELLGGKGANLAEMTNLGVPVPPGFTIATKVCREFYKSKGKWPVGLEREVNRNLAKLEKAMDATLGDPDKPLLVSVRSGAAVSMPGMMDTVLNLGLNDDVIEGIIKKTRNPRFAYDIYRRFIDMFGDVVMGCDHEYFEEVIHTAKEKAGVNLDNELSAKQLEDVVAKYKNVYKKHVGELFPQDGKTQLKHAINAVFGSWNIARAVKYRQLNNITGLLGTAVNVQAMVFGNMGRGCGTGVCFTRNPSTGKKEFYGEFLMNAQGEDVVAGIRTPVPLKKLGRVMPKAYKQLTDLMTRLEKHYKDMQDMEFTIQSKVLYILQTRTGKRTAEAAVKIAVDMVQEKLIPRKEAVNRVEPEQLDRLLHPHFDPKATRKVIAKGLPASPGAAVGQAVFTADTAEAWKAKGKKVVLIRIETSPEDIGGMDAAVGILTARGGMTSHAAVVARGMGKCCVAGVGSLNINYKTKKLTVDKLTIKEGDWISLDGSTGELMTGQLPTVEPKMSGDFGKFMEICDKIRKLGVRTNADTPDDSKRAREFGAEGIGLCRTEHMFFEGDRIWPVRQIILAADDYALMLEKIEAAETVKEKKAIEKENAVAKKQFEGALKKLLPYQRSDFEGIFKAMAGLPVTIRLLDPPLHEFLPQDRASQAEMALRLGIKPAAVKAKVDQLHEFNPMLGHRGCRLAITYPPICRMQARAIIEAALNVKKTGKVVLPEIMVPLAGELKEYKLVKDEIVAEIKKVFKERKARIRYMIGTMIEVPRAALTADEIATEAEFFSFGTNDLTQMTMGFSRDDAGKFLGEYVNKGIYAADPFQQLDQVGVGKLVEMGTRLGRKTKKKLKVGICGEHGGEPSSIDFCHRVGMNYVSCSPFRVPIARLSAAQAAVR